MASASSSVQTVEDVEFSVLGLPVADEEGVLEDSVRGELDTPLPLPAAPKAELIRR